MQAANSNTKTPEIQTKFRKNELQQHPSVNNNSVLSQQANMMIRGRSDKNAHTVMQQYTNSHELPTVVLKQKQ